METGPVFPARVPSQPSQQDASALKQHFWRVLHLAEARHDAFPDGHGPYNQPKLLRMCAVHAIRAGSENLLAKAFLEHASIAITAEAEPETALQDVALFANELVSSLFLPLRISAASYALSLPTSGCTSVAAALFPPSPITIAGQNCRYTESGRHAANVLAVLDPAASAQLLGHVITQPNNTHLNTVLLASSSAAALCQFDMCLRPYSEDTDGVNEGAHNGYVLSCIGHKGACAETDRQVVNLGSTSPVLVRLHSTVADILSESGAGRYITRILADTRIEDMRAAGMQHLGLLMQLRLDGWWDGGHICGQTLLHDEGDGETETVWEDRGEFVKEEAVR